MSKETLELERLKDWFIDKYDWECYKQAEKEFLKMKQWKSFPFFKSLKEEERQWLIKRTREIIEEKWKKKLKQ